MPDSVMFTTEWTVQYFETDRMGIVHHSNYIRWMETARVRFMAHFGVPLTEMEAAGIVVPVVDVAAAYKRPAVFGDTVTIDLTMTEYTGVRVRFGYTIKSAAGHLLCEAKSTHAFTSTETLRVLSLARQWPALHDRLNAIAEGRALREETPPCDSRSL